MVRLYFSFIFLLVSFSTVLFAQPKQFHQVGEYVVTIKGDRNIMNYAKTRSEIKGLEGTPFCPNQQVLLITKKWGCRIKKNDQQFCLGKFNCQQTPENFESLKKKKLSQIRGFFHKEPLNYKAWLFYKNAEGALKKVSLISSDSPELLLQQHNEKVVKNINKKKKKNLEQEKQRIRNNKNVRSQEENSSQDSSSLELLSFAGSLLSISDENNNSLFTTQLAWSPYYDFSNNWMLGLQAGAHLFNQANLNESESFVVTEFGASLGKTIYKNIFLRVGAGIQSWRDEQAQSFQYKSLSLGYQFHQPKLQVIDKLSLGLVSVDARESIREIRLKINFTFF